MRYPRPYDGLIINRKTFEGSFDPKFRIAQSFEQFRKSSCNNMAFGVPTRISDLFPTKGSFVIFVLYMALFINQGILVKLSQNAESGYSYSTITAVLLTEVIKLIFSSGYYSHQYSIASFFEEIFKSPKVFLYYMIPAFLYCLYNNLTYTNLSSFDPTTYFLLLQLRVVVTGIVFQILFQKRLSKRQWFSLILLTAGCMIKGMNFSALFQTKQDSHAGFFEMGASIFLILLQIFSSSSAGVYNEYLLKSPLASAVPILVQNSCLYIDSIICNFLFLHHSGGLDLQSFTSILKSPIFLIVVLNNAAIGIVTSFFLAKLNSILKTFASALELLFTAILCFLIFGIPIYFNTILAIFVVTLAIYIYSFEPVVNTKVTAKEKDVEEMQKMLDEQMDVV